MDDSRKFVQEWQISINGEEITRVRPGETAVIGRKPLRAIPEEKGIRRVDITDVTKSMSKRHVLLKTDFDGNASIEDLGSTNGTFIQQDNGALLRIPFNTPFSFPRMIERVQLGEVPVDFIKVKSEISAASPAGQNSDDLFTEADDGSASIVPQRKMSVDEIMDLRAGEPTSMFAADNVRSAVQEKNDLAAAAAAAPEFAPVAAEEQANNFESESAARPVRVGSVNPAVSQMSVPEMSVSEMTVPEVNAPEVSTAATASAEVNDSEVSVQALQEYAAAETAAETAVGESVPAESVSAGSVSAGSVQSESLPDAGFSFENAEFETVSAENTVSAQSAADTENTGDDGVSVENAAIENAAAAKTSEANAATVSGAESVSQQAAKQTEEQSSEQEAGQQNAALNDADASLFDTEWDGTVINDAVNAASNIAAASNTASESALFESEQSSQSVLNMQSVQNVQNAQNESAQIDESALFPTFTDPAFDQQPAQQQSAEQQAQSSSEQMQSEQTQSESVQSETARQSQSEEYAKKDTPLFSNSEWPVFPDETAGDGYSNDVLEHKPVYEAGSVFDRLQRNEYGKTASVVEEGGYTSDKARTSSDYSEQFAMAQLPSLLPFLAMNPSLYDDLYAWLQAQGNADIDKALTDNAGFRRWAANQGK